MNSLLPVTINGVQFNANPEYTSTAVADEYQSDLAAFVNIFNLGLSTDSAVPPSTSDLANAIINAINSGTYAQQLQAALNGGTVTLNAGTSSAQDVTVIGLLNLAQQGIVDPTSGTTQYMTTNMSNALQQLITSLQMAGVTFTQTGSGGLVAGNISSQMVQNWKNLADSSTAIQTMLSNANTAATSDNRTLQALVELVYVETGNSILTNNLNTLQNALQATSNALSTLNSLQSLSNQVTAVTPPSFSSYASSTYSATNVTAFVTGKSGVPGIDNAASSYFAGIDPTILGTISESELSQFLSLRGSLIQEIQALSGQTSGTASAQGGTLVGNLRNVLTDINYAFAKAGIASGAIGGITNTNVVMSALTYWLVDSNAVVHTNMNISQLGSGQIQRDLTAAITAGQSLNNSQQQNVQDYMFVFQEYYKSAAAILNSITQIIQSMAQNISK